MKAYTVKLAARIRVRAADSDDAVAWTKTILADHVFQGTSNHLILRIEQPGDDPEQFIAEVIFETEVTGSDEQDARGMARVIRDYFDNHDIATVVLDVTERE